MIPKACESALSRRNALRSNAGGSSSVRSGTIDLIDDDFDVKTPARLRSIMIVGFQPVVSLVPPNRIVDHRQDQE